MASLEHLSYSSVSLYLDCAHAWRLRYLDRVRTPTAPALVFGSAWHTMAEEYLRTGRDPAALWRRAWCRQLDREGEVGWGEESAAELAERGERMAQAPAVAAMLRELREAFDPQTGALERRVELAVPGVDVPVIGYVDVQTRDGVPGDLKTAARMWTRARAAGELQPLVYLAALNHAGEAAWETGAHGWRFRHYVVTKSQRPAARVFETERSPEEVMHRLFPAVQGAWAGIRAGVFPPNTQSWRCSPRWCAYWDVCQDAGARSPGTESSP